LIEQEKLSEALALAKSIPNIGFSDSYRCEALKENAVKQLMIGNQEIYISLLTEIGRNSRYNQAIYDGLHQLSLRRKLVDVVSLIKDLLVYQPNPDQEAVKNVFLKNIVELSNRAFFNEALFIHKDISNSDMQDDVLGLLAKQACQKGYYDFSVKTSQAIKNKVERIHTLRLMSNILNDKGLTKRSQFIFQKATQLSKKITDEYNNDNSEVLNCFALDLSKKEQFKEAYLFIQQIANEHTKILALLSMATELHVKKQKTYANTLINEALNCARIFSEKVDQCFALIHVAKELNKQGESQRAIKILLEAFSISVNMETEEILGIKDESLKYSIMKDIAVEFSKLGKLKDSMGIIQHMDDDTIMDWKSITFKEIALELVKLKHLDDSLFIVNQITDVFERNKAYSQIALELSNQNEFVLAENIVLEISERNPRKNTIIEMGVRFYKQHGWDVSLKYFLNTQNNELYLNYLNSLVEHSNIKDYNLGSMKSIILFMREDISALYTATTKYALNQLYFNNQNQKLIERFNHSLNFQWAIDLKNQMN